MLQKIRDNAHGWWTWVFVPVLIIVFALFGIQNYLGGGFAQNEVARVNGESISANAFSMVYQSMNSAQSQSASKQSTSVIKLQALSTLVTQTILAQSLQQLGFSVSDARVADLISKMPVFQQNGQFSMPLYQGFLQNDGLTTADLKAEIAQSDIIAQFQKGLGLSAFALPSEVTLETAYANQVRDVDYATIPLSLFTPKSAPTAAEISAYYAANQNNFMSPLQVKLAYVKISQSQFATDGNTQKTAAASYSAALNQIANLAFQNAGSLDPIAKAYNINVTTTGVLDASHPTDILANPAVLQAVKSSSVLSQGNNSNVINLSPTEAVVVRVLSSTPQTPLPLSKVKPEIIAAIQQAHTMNTATNTLNSIVNAINQGGSLVAIAKEYNLPIQHLQGMNAYTKGLPSSLSNQLIRMAANQGTAVLNSNTFTVAEVMRVYSDPKAQKAAVSPETIMNMWNQIEIMQYLSSAQAHAKINVNQAFFK